MFSKKKKKKPARHNPHFFKKIQVISYAEINLKRLNKRKD